MSFRFRTEFLDNSLYAGFSYLFKVASDTPHPFANSINLNNLVSREIAILVCKMVVESWSNRFLTL
jgi:hypothetical protein